MLRLSTRLSAVDKVRLADVARAAGVSIAAVSRTMNQNGYVAEDVQARIHRAADEIGYVHPNHKKPIRRKNVIGLISTLAALNPFIPAMNDALQMQAAEKDYYCVQASSGQLDNDKLAYHAEQLSKLGVCGLLITGFFAETLSEDTRLLLFSLKIPVVFLERADGCQGFNRVLVDSSIGTYVATKHLIDKGHRRLAYITLNTEGTIESNRMKGFRRAIDGAESPDITHTIVSCNQVTPLSAAMAMRSALDVTPDITGVVAWNDLFAAGAQYVFEQIGRSASNGAVEIIGHDNVLAPFMPAPIGSVQMPIGEIASSAIEIVDKQLHSKTPLSPRTITLEPKLVLID